MNKISVEEYNTIPVHYCINCLSLKIVILEGTEWDYCDSCGSMDVGVCDTIDEWQELYRKKYKHDF